MKHMLYTTYTFKHEVKRLEIGMLTMKIRYSFLIAMLFSCSSVLAHHSVGGLFDKDAFVTFEVEVVEYQFINPHPYMTATRTDGSDELLTLDMDNRREFSALNIDQSTFVPGDKLLVTLNPNHVPSTTFYVNAIEHPRLGFKYVTNVRQLLSLE